MVIETTGNKMFAVSYYEAETNQAGEGLWRTDDEAQQHVARVKADYPNATVTVMPEASARKQIGAVHWLKHCGSWFGFAEPVKAVSDPDGAFFASLKTGERVKSIALNGLKEPA